MHQSDFSFYTAAHRFESTSARITALILAYYFWTHGQQSDRSEGFNRLQWNYDAFASWWLFSVVISIFASRSGWDRTGSEKMWDL